MMSDVRCLMEDGRWKMEIINSYDMEEVFGSELNSSGIGPNPQIKNSQNDKNYFNQPIHTLMRKEMELILIILLT